MTPAHALMIVQDAIDDAVAELAQTDLDGTGKILAA
jgi:hypothetical protein